jgi:hypothetical protein
MIGSAVADRPTSTADRLQTEFEFELPRGYIDNRVRENPAYLTVVLLARVITRLGTITDFHAGLVENLFASDLAFLQDLYRRVNQEGHTRAALTCPACKHEFSVDLAGDRLGEL